MLGRLKHISVTKQNYALKRVLLTVVSYAKKKGGGVEKKERFISVPLQGGIDLFFEGSWPFMFLSC